MSRSSEPTIETAAARARTPCSGCGVSVDPLRAARVRLISDRFHYFCSADCADDFSLPDDDMPESEPRRSTPTSDAAAPVQLRTPSFLRTPQARESTRPPFAETPSHTPTPSPSAAPAGPAKKPITHPTANVVGKSERWLITAQACGWIAIGLLLAEESTLLQSVRVAALLLGTLCYAVVGLFVERSSERRFAAVGVALCTLTSALLGGLLLAQRTEVSTVINFGATLLVASTGGALLLQRLFQPIDEQRQALRRWLSQPTTRVVGDQLERVPLEQLRPGEEIVVHAGETVVADVTVVAGKAEVLPWFNATAVHSVGPEHFVYAGSKLMSGQIRATVRWTGLDRHWERLTNDPMRRADLHSPLTALARKLALRGAPLLAFMAWLAGSSVSSTWVTHALVTLASLAALLGAGLDRLVGQHIHKAVLIALDRGIVFRSAAAFDAAGRVSTAVFCARGTLLLGEPELSSVEVSGKLTEDEVLALAAGAEQGQQSPLSIALMRAIRARGVAPDAVRSPQSDAGLGVTAIASNGKALVVGSRGLLLRERVSVARAEARITELEALGRTVVLVALGGHLVGLLGLQDGLRAGARAAVQHLLDANIEPVLLTGEARKSGEALGRTIDIEHLRPEVLPLERGREVERLKSGGAQVAVIGRSPTDEIALSAASVSIALPSVGTPNLDHDVEIATNEVQRAALALSLARQCRTKALYSIGIAAGGSIATVLATVAISAPIAFAPLGCLLFVMIAAVGTNSQSGDAGSLVTRADDAGDRA